MRFDAQLRRALEHARAAPTEPSEVDADLREYALENLLLVQTEAGVRVTRLGTTFAQLRGRDAIRFLLILETTLCVAEGDPHRTSLGFLRDLMLGIEIEEVAGSGRWFNTPTIDRMGEMGVLTATAGAFIVEPHLRDVVADVLTPGPWHAAIHALLDDERAAFLPAGTLQALVAEATVEQSRMLTHELRNALIPVRHHLDALGDLGDGPRQRIEKARSGVARVLHFVDQLVTTADLLSEASSRCDLAALVVEALGRIESSERITVRAAPAPTLVSAPRQRLVIALANLIQNAVQHSPPDAAIETSWSVVAGELHIRVDDSGPGVPAADRSRIFDDGYTTRPGGSGFGLANVRKLVETTLRGRVWCEESDLGGARFVIAIPTRVP